MYTPRQFVETGKIAARDPILRWSAFFFLVVFVLVLVVGCGFEESAAPEAHEPAADLMPYSGLRFTVLVTDEPLAMAIDAMAEDWFAQTQSKLSVITATEHELLARGGFEADGAVIPTRLVGLLRQRGMIEPLAREPLDAVSDKWLAVFERCRRPEATWGGEMVAVPFGGPVFTIYYRADLLKKLGKTPPGTWEEYASLAAFLNDRENLGALVPAPPMPWAGAIEPLEARFAGLILLARAAPYWERAGTASCLFDPETMEPRIAEPPMVRALAELAAATAFGPESPQVYTPDSVREAFWLGECGMAVSWPTSAAHFGPVFEGRAEAGFSELPGAAEYFDETRKTWKPRAEGHVARVPLLGVSGRAGVVGSLSRNKRGTTELLLWLATEPWGTPPSSKTSATTLYTDSQVREPEMWVESLVAPKASAQYAALTKKTLNRDAWLQVPRIPGREDYLAALSRAVKSVLDGTTEPRAALEKAAAEWREITGRYGVESQRGAYSASLGR